MDLGHCLTYSVIISSLDQCLAEYVICQFFGKYYLGKQHGVVP